MKLVKEGKHVFPAYAGMFLPYVGAHNGHYGFPRIRGDVPTGWLVALGESGFSPHTRGCSRIDEERDRRHAVFPAYAGMFPPTTMVTPCSCRFPRIRGDVPLRIGT